MSAYAGVQGYENLSSAQQQERSNAEALGLARKPSTAPAHLSRVLYIPTHGNLDFHLLVQDVSADYKHAINYSPLGGRDIIGDAPMGSRLFMRRLETLRKPEASSKDSETQYVIDAGSDTNGAYATVQGQAPASSTRISLPLAADDFSLKGKNNADININTSFPIPNSTTTIGTVRHPFFTFSTEHSQRTLEWQIDPIVSGPLRYTLVEIDNGPSENDDDESLRKPEIIKAIYHHIGQGASLSMPSSEGVLLLPRDAGSETELVTVASLVGLLWRVRAMEAQPVVDNASPSSKRSFLQRVFRRD